MLSINQPINPSTIAMYLVIPLTGIFPNPKVEKVFILSTTEFNARIKTR